MADKPLAMDGARVAGWALIKAKHNSRSGEEVEPAKLKLVLEIPLEHALAHLGRLARMFRKGDTIALTLVTLVEQLELAPKDSE